jgi:hypothetical protein
MVLETINGMPAHVLLVHAAVVFVPLLALGAIVFAVWPAVRHRIDWAVALLAVVAPVSALFSMISGNAFYEMREADGTPKEFLDQIGEHASYGRRAPAADPARRHAEGGDRRAERGRGGAGVDHRLLRGDDRRHRRVDELEDLETRLEEEPSADGAERDHHHDQRADPDAVAQAACAGLGGVERAQLLPGQVARRRGRPQHRRSPAGRRRGLRRRAGVSGLRGGRGRAGDVPPGAVVVRGTAGGGHVV